MITVRLYLEPKTHQAFTRYAAHYAGDKTDAFMTILLRALGKTSARPQHQHKDAEVIDRLVRGYNQKKTAVPPRLYEAYEILVLGQDPPMLTYREQIPIHIPQYLQKDFTDLMKNQDKPPSAFARDLVQEFFGEGPSRKDGLTPHVIREFERIHDHTGWKVLPELDTLHGVVGDAAPFLDLEIVRKLYRGWVSER